MHVLTCGCSTIYITTEYDMDDIPTYEEVELFQPNPGRFRPVVLIGNSELTHDYLCTNKCIYVSLV